MVCGKSLLRVKHFPKKPGNESETLRKTGYITGLLILYHHYKLIFYINWSAKNARTVA